MKTSDMENSDLLKEIKTDSVSVLVPCGGPVEPRVLQSVSAMAAYSSAHEYPVAYVGVTDRTLVHTARNTLASHFLKSDSEWAFWGDSDMIFEARTIPTLMKWAKKLNAKMVSGVYFQRMGAHRPLVMIRDRKKTYDDDYQMSFVAPNTNGDRRAFEIDACGFGCVLMHRSVFDDIEYPYFKNIYIDKEGKKELSEDFYFCRQVRQAGIKIYAVPEIVLGHLGSAPIIFEKDFHEKFKLQELKEKEAV